MKRIIAILLVGISFSLGAQKIYRQSVPVFSDANSVEISFAESAFVMPKIGNPKNQLGPYIAAKSLSTDLSDADVQWSEVDGQLVGDLTVFVNNATSINLLLTKVEWPKGTELFLVTEDGFFGPYIGRNMDQNSFSHFPISTNKITLHFQMPNTEKDDLRFKVSTINASFDNALKDGSCNIASICPEANAYRKAQKSTVIISANGSGFCTGTLINNTSRDFTPYIITAQHCLGGSTNLSNWTFAFNYEAAQCNSPDNNNGKSFSLRGADIVAQNGSSDFALLLLREDFGPNDSVHFAGWNKQIESAEKQIVYHHPNGALKRFSLNDNAAEPTTYLESNAPPFVWKIDKWEEGTTEGGSSGSSLMNAEGQVVGTLVGGEASCNNVNGSDYFGRMDVGFKPSDDWTTTLKPWLDPNHGNYDSIDGRDYPYSILPNTDLAIKAIYGISSVSCDGVYEPKIVVKNVGKNAVGGYSLNIDLSGQANWTPLQAIGTLQPGESFEYSFEARQFSSGNLTFTVLLNVDGDSYPKNNTGYITTSVLENAISLSMSVTVDAYGSENYWEIFDQSGNLVVSGGPYPNDEDGETYVNEFCLEEACYSLVFHDTYGDGMCCEYGDGSFVLSYGNGTVVSQGYDGPTNTIGQPTKQENTICITANSVVENDLQSISLFPNPSNPAEVLLLNGVEHNSEVNIVAMTGKTISTQRGNQIIAPRIKGVYLIVIEGFSPEKLLVK